MSGLYIVFYEQFAKAKTFTGLSRNLHLFIMVYKVVLPFMSEDQFLEYGNSNDSFSIVPCNGALCVSEFIVQN